MSFAVLYDLLAGGQGLEPRLPHSECDVLPLDDPPKINNMNLDSPTYYHTNEEKDSTT